MKRRTITSNRREAPRGVGAKHLPSRWQALSSQAFFDKRPRNATQQAQVDELAKVLKDAKVVLLTDYRGITVTDVTKLRADLRNANAEYKVIKNNIIKRALDANGESGLDDLLEGPTALVIGTEDYLEPSKVIYNFSKNNEFYKIKGGIIDGKVMTAEEIITLAKLPSRQELMAKLAGALLGNITKLAVALDAVREQKANA